MQSDFKGSHYPAIAIACAMLAVTLAAQDNLGNMTRGFKEGETVTVGPITDIGGLPAPEPSVEIRALGAAVAAPIDSVQIEDNWIYTWYKLRVDDIIARDPLSLTRKGCGPLARPYPVETNQLDLFTLGGETVRHGVNIIQMRDMKKLTINRRGLFLFHLCSDDMAYFSSWPRPEFDIADDGTLMYSGESSPLVELVLSKKTLDGFKGYRQSLDVSR